MSGQAGLVESKLARASALVLERHESFLADPGDVETNHKLRVSIRTLRGLVAFLEPWQKPKQGKRVQRKLKKVVRETSLLRELDVLAQRARQLRPEDGELIAFLEGEAACERARVYGALSSQDAHDKLSEVYRDLHDVSWKRPFDAAEARARFDALADGLKRDLDSLDIADYELVHSVRKRAKQVRYVAEQFEEVLGSDVVATAKHMKSQQDHLGAMCDAQVNRRLVDSFLQRPDLPRALAAALESLV